MLRVGSADELIIFSFDFPSDQPYFFGPFFLFVFPRTTTEKTHCSNTHIMMAHHDADYCKLFLLYKHPNRLCESQTSLGH